jgi:hypothetical protein
VYRNDVPSTKEERSELGVTSPHVKNGAAGWEVKKLRKGSLLDIEHPLPNWPREPGGVPLGG